MKITLRFLAIAALLAVVNIASAQEKGEGKAVIGQTTLDRNGSFMTVGIGFDFNGLGLKPTQAAIFTPMIVNGGDTLRLTPVGVYGRTAWYQSERGILKAEKMESLIPLRYDKKIEPFNYSGNVDYAEWMNGATLQVREELYGCAGCNEGVIVTDDLVAYFEPEILQLEPALIYQTAVAEEIKTRELSGRAFVDFPVNKIVIYPDYRNNHYELGKIIATIDSVKNDPDITVNSIFIKGTASPEGPYDNNVYLAKNRTIALKEYVTNLYKFPKDFIQTDYNPVDWPGLREWLESNNIEYKEEILAIVNSDIESYARNSRIKKDYPKQYDWLLRNVYPALRHSDYKIEYTIREFSNIAEIAEIIKTAPQKLSLNEMYRLAGTLEPGSPEYNEVFEIAVRMYPNDETANLNAGNTALARGDLEYAEKYLQKAGETAQAVYARGILKGMQGDYDEAVRLIEQAQSMGLNGGGDMLEKIRSLQRWQ